ncbi:DgyrCDS13680 [Dimorphilus gyrociliatus]|uniref:DgyrCDS13680 n=1 Tax=Dimorphilus gyrociliatus TaxID=2664684 RepID=A0A7I8WBI1_9ANNE|nr:DgyrCDS13680 [Dimorphilus gyrociliatus]
MKIVLVLFVALFGLCKGSYDFPFPRSSSGCNDLGLVDQIVNTWKENSKILRFFTNLYDSISIYIDIYRPMAERLVCQLADAKSEREFNQVITNTFGIDGYTLAVYEDIFFQNLRPIREYEESLSAWTDLLEFLEKHWKGKFPIDADFIEVKSFLEKMNEKYGNHWLALLIPAENVADYYSIALFEINNDEIDKLAILISEATSVAEFAEQLQLPSYETRHVVDYFNMILTNKYPADWRIFVKLFKEIINILKISKKLGFLDIF